MNTEWAVTDVAVLRHILEQGSKNLFENKVSPLMTADQVIKAGERFQFTEMDF